MRTVLHWHRPLMLFAAAMAGLAVVSAAGLVLDDRILLGAPIWLKPFKFAVSFVLYCVTWSWLMSLRDKPSRALWWFGTGIVATAAVEMAVIVVQVVRGRASHFNYATPLDSTLFRIMAGTIVVLWVCSLLAAIWVGVRGAPGDRAATLAVRLGVGVAVIGLALGFLMTRQPSGVAGLVGAHSVGVPDGGPGMAITGWSTTGGDLRIGHFVGMHALQALPLTALALTALSRRFPLLGNDSVRARLVGTAGFGYAGLVALVTWQALRGQPLLAPDSVTLTALGALLVACAIGVAFALAARPVRALVPA